MTSLDLMVLDDIKDSVWRGGSRTILIEKVKNNRLINCLSEEFVVHDKDTAIRQEHHTLEHILESLIDSSALVSYDLPCSGRNLTLLRHLLSPGWLGDLAVGTSDSTVRSSRTSHCVSITTAASSLGSPLNHVAVIWLDTVRNLSSLNLILADESRAALRVRNTVHVGDHIGLQREDTMILEPKEHYFLEVGLSCLEKSFKFVQLREFDDLKNLT